VLIPPNLENMSIWKRALVALMVLLTAAFILLMLSLAFETAAPAAG
jgi:hypothetical protein